MKDVRKKSRRMSTLGFSFPVSGEHWGQEPGERVEEVLLCFGTEPIHYVNNQKIENGQGCESDLGLGALVTMVPRSVPAHSSSFLLRFLTLFVSSPACSQPGPDVLP